MTRMKKNEIRKLFGKLLKPHLNNLFFPHGIHGQIAYYLEKQGYYGPYTIPAYMVPLCFSSEALSKLKENSDKHGIPIEAAHPADVLDKLVDGIDLGYGNRSRLSPLTFVDMVSSGCEPDIYYLDRDFNNDEYMRFFDFLDDTILVKHIRTSWTDLGAADMKFWCHMFANCAEKPRKLARVVKG